MNYEIEKTNENSYIITIGQKKIERTKKDFRIFADLLKNNHTDLLLPKVKKKDDWENWLKKIKKYNKSLNLKKDFVDFLTNKNFYVLEKETNYYQLMNNYMSKINEVINKKENLKSLIFIDKKNEKKLYLEDKKIKKFFELLCYLKNILYEKIDKNNFFKNKLTKMKSNLKYILFEELDKFNGKKKMIDKKIISAIISKIDNLIEFLEDIIFFFERKNEIYKEFEKIKKIILFSNFDYKINDKTINNPQNIIDHFGEKILRYNENIINLLENNEIIINIENTILVIIQDVNEIF